MSDKLTDAEIDECQTQVQELARIIENQSTFENIAKVIGLICPVATRLIDERKQSAESDLLRACYMCLGTMERTGQSFHGIGTMKSAIAKAEANQ